MSFPLLKFLIVFLSISISLWKCALSKQERVKYTGYASYKFFPQTEKDVEIMKILHDKNPGVIFLKQPGSIQQSVDILFAPHLQTDLLQNLKGQMPHKLVTEDMESLMDHESHLLALEALDVDEFSFDLFWNWEKCMAWNKHVAETHPNLVTLETYGQSGEGRPLQALVVNDKTQGTNKEVVFIDGLTHAREWITVMSCNYFLNELISGKPEYNDLLSNFIFVLACLVNPDGFVYSFLINRLWRKTRTNNNDFLCIGVDPNRNYPYGHAGPGSSTDKCSEVYSGPFPLSIPETASLSKYLLSWKPVSYQNLHSYSQLAISPYGCTAGSRGTDIEYEGFEEHLKLTNLGLSKLQTVHGSNYTAGNGMKSLYQACGTADDAAKANGVNYVITWELRDTGTFGFVLPATQIRPTCEEFTAAMLVIHKGLHQMILQEKAAESQTETILSEAEAE